MSLLALGVNHKTAPVEIRERVAFAPERLDEALRDLVSRPAVNEAAILSTCNRTEVYCRLQSADGEQAVVDWLRDYHRLRREQLVPYLYAHPEQDAVRHVLRVASGLDSLVLGEPQILGQLKEAYTRASTAGSLGRILNRLFQHTFAVAKQVRTDTAIGSSPVSVAFAAVSLARQIFADLAEHPVLLIGAGETIELVARHLYDNGRPRMIVANRTLERARDLAQAFDAEAVSLAEVPRHLEQADIVITSTGSQLPILGKGAVESAMRRRKHRPMFMVDIAVPRDVETEVGELDDVYLYTVDDLHEVIEENRKSRQAAAAEAEDIIENQVEHFLGWLRAQNAVHSIRAYRLYAEQLREDALLHARRRLAAGRDPQQVMDELARQLTNKLLHEPCVQMNHAAYQGRTALLDAARELFNLRDDDAENTP